MSGRIALSASLLVTVVGTGACCRPCCPPAATRAYAPRVVTTAPAPSAPSVPATPAAPAAETSTGMPPGMEEKMKEWAALMTPGPHHEVLKEFEGSWIGKGKVTEEGMTTAFTEEVDAKLVFGGRFLQMDSTMKTEEGGPMPAFTMTTRGFVGYDNAKQVYTQSMLGDWSTSIGTAEGTYDPATKTFSMTGVESLGKGKERKFRMVQRIVSKDEWNFEMFFTPPGGKEAKAGEATYKRK